MEVIQELKKAVGTHDWNKVIEMIEELEILKREQDEEYEFPDFDDWGDEEV
tara:strand:+ start:291 stop:443 length:153 start_codon:yes stop_codon:yes gene_type:complete